MVMENIKVNIHEKEIISVFIRHLINAKRYLVAGSPLAPGCFSGHRLLSCPRPLECICLSFVGGGEVGLLVAEQPGKASVQ